MAELGVKLTHKAIQRQIAREMLSALRARTGR